MGKKEREKARRRQEARHTSLNLPLVPPEGAFEYSAISWMRRNEPKVKTLLDLIRGRLVSEGSPITRLAVASYTIYTFMEEVPDATSGRYSQKFVADFTIGCKLFASSLVNGERHSMGLSKEDFADIAGEYIPLKDRQSAYEISLPLLKELGDRIGKESDGFKAGDYLCIALADKEKPWAPNANQEHFTRGVNFANVLYKELYQRTEGLRLN